MEMEWEDFECFEVGNEGVGYMGRREGVKNERHGVYIIMIFILMISLSYA
jgi:hypothetical protein